MDLYLLRRFETIVAAVILTIILVGGAFVWLWLKEAWATRKAKREVRALSNTSAARYRGHKIREWVQVGEYEIYVHKVTEQLRSDGQQQERVIYADVEYRNQTDEESMSCRRNQWHLFDENGYSYEAQSEIGASRLYQEKRYFGGDRFIDPGMNVRGWLAFTVPQDARITILQFMTQFINTKTKSIMVENDIEREASVNTVKGLRPDPRSL